MIKKHAIAIVVVFLLATACGSDPIDRKKESVNKEKTRFNSIHKSPPGLVGCWQLSKFAYNLNDFDDESKWLTEKNGALMILRDDGKFMKWFGDYGDIGNFELRNDSLFLNLKDSDGSTTTSFRLDTLTQFEMIITNKDEFVPILKYRKLSQQVYDFWKAKFK